MRVTFTYTVMLITFCALDLVWLGVIAHKFYFTQLNHILSPKVNWTPAVIFYLLFITGMLVFVVIPTQRSPLLKVILMAFLFGVVTYATYDLTNHATLKNWPLIVSIVDIIWGGIISTAVCLTGHFIIKF